MSPDGLLDITILAELAAYGRERAMAGLIMAVFRRQSTPTLMHCQALYAISARISATLDFISMKPHIPERHRQYFEFMPPHAQSNARISSMMLPFPLTSCQDADFAS